jgi:hypothetical protein
MLTYVVIEIISTLTDGTNLGSFRLGVIIVVCLLIRHPQGQIRTVRRWLKLAPIFFVVIIYFVATTTSRLGWESLPTISGGIPIDRRNLFIFALPDSLAMSVVLVCSYLGQGYYGFHLALQQQFTGCWGFGSGNQPMRIYEVFFGETDWSCTYQMKEADLWNPTINWHTAFTWMANDVTFVGVAVLMFIIAALLVVVLSDATRTRAPIPMALSCLYAILLLFLPMNNITMSNPTIFIPFITLHAAWLLWRYHTIRSTEKANASPLVVRESR